MVVIDKLSLLKDSNSLWNMTGRMEKAKKNLNHVDLDVKL